MSFDSDYVAEAASDFVTGAWRQGSASTGAQGRDG
jgi:hypothetical protein